MQEVLLEIEALEAIFADELFVDKSKIKTKYPVVVLQRKIHPMDELALTSCCNFSSSASAVIRISIDLKLYPYKLSSVSISEPRGISDSDLRLMETQIVSYLEKHEGNAVLFDIFQSFPRCPVCRNPLNIDDLDQFLTIPDDSMNKIDDSNIYFDLNGWLKKQHEHRIIFEKKQNQGELIELEQDKLIVENTTANEPCSSNEKQEKKPSLNPFRRKRRPMGKSSLKSTI